MSHNSPVKSPCLRLIGLGNAVAMLLLLLNRCSLTDGLQVMPRPLAEWQLSLKLPRHISAPRVHKQSRYLTNKGVTVLYTTTLDDNADDISNDIALVDDEELQKEFQIQLLIRDYMRNFWKGITLPFPALRRLILLPQEKINVGLSFREGLLALAAYLSIGVLAFHVVLEKWPIVDALYFTCVCFSTVGYGDLVPTNLASRIFTTIFGMGGIAFLGAAVATIGSTFVQTEVEATKKARRESSKRLMQLFEGMPKVASKIKKLSGSNGSSEEKGGLLAARERAKNSKESKAATSAEKVIGIMQRVVPAFAVIVGGGAIMGRLNGWTFGESLYYSLITASTIGYGDYAPQTRSARIFAIFFIPLAVASAGELLSSMALELVQRRQRRIYEEQLEHELTLEHLKVMDSDDDGKISREEYVEFMLIQMGRIDKDELKELFRQFDRLDVSKSGYLDNDDLRMMARLKGANVID